MSIRHSLAALKWLPEHDDALRRLHADGASGAQAAEAINFGFRTTYSRNAVIGRKHRLGLTEVRVLHRPKKVAIRPRPAKAPVQKFVEPKLDREEIVLRCVEVVPRMIPLLDLAPGECKWPYGDSDFRFCGNPSGDHVYCAPHKGLSVNQR